VVSRGEPVVSGPRRRRPIFARVYAYLSPKMEREGVAEFRAELLAGLTGRVIEVGAGNGLNFAHYPPEVTGVLALEPEPYLRDLAHRAAETAPVPVEVVEGVAERLPAADASADAVVVSLMLCSVADQQAVLGEIHRVLRPGGRLHFFEHVLAETPGLARVQRVLDATVWPHIGGGCHAARDTAAAIEAGGFGIERVRRFRFPETGIPSHTSPHVLGVASRG